MKVLAIGSDVASLTSYCGATLEKLSREGHQVSIAIACSSNQLPPVAELNKGVHPNTAKSEPSAALANLSNKENDGVGSLLQKRWTAELSYVLDFDYSAVTQRNGDLLTERITKIKPDLVIIPYWKAADDAARILSRSALIACRGIGSILMYNGNRKSDASDQFAPNVTFPVARDSLGGDSISSDNIDTASSTETLESHRLLLLHDNAVDWL